MVLIFARGVVSTRGWSAFGKQHFPKKARVFSYKHLNNFLFTIREPNTKLRRKPREPSCVLLFLLSESKFRDGVLNCLVRRRSGVASSTEINFSPQKIISSRRVDWFLSSLSFIDFTAKRNLHRKQ